MHGASNDPELPVLVGKAVESLAALMPAEIAPLVPFGGYLTEVLVRHQQQRWLRWEETLQEAASDAGSPVEDLLESLDADPVRRELLARVLEASGQAIDPDKVRALGRVLSRGLDGDRIDEAVMLAEAFGAIEAPHVQVLKKMTKQGPLNRNDLDGRFRDQKMVLPALLAALSRTGLIESGAISDDEIDMSGGETVMVKTWETHWWTTPLGDECLALLAAVAADEAS